MTDSDADQRLGDRWCWPVDRTRYDCNPRLTPQEWEALDSSMRRRGPGARWTRQAAAILQRLLKPLNDVLQLSRPCQATRHQTARVLLQEMHYRQTSFWAWAPAQWAEILSAQSRAAETRRQLGLAHTHLLLLAYLLCDFREFHAVGTFNQYMFATRVFGQAPVDAAIEQIYSELRRWGPTGGGAAKLQRVICLILIVNRSPDLECITLAVLNTLLQQERSPYSRLLLNRVSRALVGLGILPATLHGATSASPHPGAPDTLADVPLEWAHWAQRWYDTSTLARKSRAGIYYLLLKAGRWLSAVHPDVVTPQQWNRELAAEFVAAVDRMLVGQWAHSPSTHRYKQRLGKPLSAQAKDQQLHALRAFFRNCQEWGWIERQFDPLRVFATPRAILACIGPSPRVIADDIWAKLLWAGLNLEAADLPRHCFIKDNWYPIEMMRAFVITWLFAGLRMDELIRLRVGCVRFQRGDTVSAGTGEALPKDAICWLDVPVNKTNTAFTKAVDRLVGEAITIWEQNRPAQPPSVDPKTGEVVDYLFAYRGRRIGRTHLNRSLIPLLCHKAGVPEQDARGAITSHRARSTIASQLANGKEPMSIFELKDWLGHRQLSSTLHYVKPSPTRVAKSYADADYFKRNVRMIEVLIDQEAITSGTAAAGEPWKFYDLGHGYCTYDFFEQCPHRMACAKCGFYRPKGSSQAQLLEAKANLGRMLQEIPLSEDERAAVEDGLRAIEQLSVQLLDVPTPAGPTPRQLATQTIAEQAITIGRPGSGGVGGGERSGEGGVRGAGEGVG